MTKFRLFISYCKERDWLEEMAAQGWMLTDITFYVFYHFKPMEPAQKVFEIDRFASWGIPDKHMLTAHSAVFSLAAEYGWEMVTHTEDMTFYFAKDKEGDVSDEFYDDDGMRREKAQRFRQYIDDQAKLCLGATIVILLLEAVRGALLGGVPAFPCIVIAFLGTLTFLTFYQGEVMYREVSMSRQQWEEYKNHAISKNFRRTNKLLAFLQEQDACGLALTDYSNGKYLFETGTRHWYYTTDTKRQLKKRLKEQNIPYREETKDWWGQGLRWYECSIEESRHIGLEPVCVAQGDVLVYKSAQPLQLNEQVDAGMGFLVRWRRAVIWFVTCGSAGVIVGFLCGYFLF